MSGANPSTLLDTMMMTAAQKVEHYEIATYGTFRGIEFGEERNHGVRGTR